jgi:hypothetical protein
MSAHNVKFKIESLDEENGQAVVRLINPYGPISTGSKTLAELSTTVDVPTGDRNSDGSVVFQSETFPPENPNDDLVYNYDIPLNVDGTMYDLAQFTDFIKTQYPIYMFREQNSRRVGVIDPALKATVGEEVNIEVEEIIEEPSVPPAEEPVEVMVSVLEII